MGSIPGGDRPIQIRNALNVQADRIGNRERMQRIRGIRRVGAYRPIDPFHADPIVQRIARNRSRDVSRKLLIPQKCHLIRDKDRCTARIIPEHVCTLQKRDPWLHACLDRKACLVCIHIRERFVLDLQSGCQKRTTCIQTSARGNQPIQRGKRLDPIQQGSQDLFGRTLGICFHQ